MVREPGLQVCREDRREHEQSPHPVNDAGDGRQQFDGHADGSLQPAWRELGDHQSDAEAHRNTHQQRDQRSDHCAVERGQRTKLSSDRIPFLAGQELQPEKLQRRPRTREERDQYAEDGQQHQRREEPG